MIGIENIAPFIDEERVWPPCSSCGSGSALAKGCIGAIARKGGDNAQRIYFANAAVALVGNVNITGGIYGHICRCMEHGGSGGSTVAIVAGSACAGDGSNGAGGTNFSDSMIACIYYVVIAPFVEGDMTWIIEFG